MTPTIQPALKLMDGILGGKYGSSIISDYVFDECVTVILARTKDLGKATFFGEKLLESFKLYHY